MTVTAANQAMCIKEMRKKELQWQKQQKRELLDVHNTVLELCEWHLQYQMKQKAANEADVKVLSEDEEKRFVSESLTVKPDGTWKYQGGLCGLLLLYTGMRCVETHLE